MEGFHMSKRIMMLFISLLSITLVFSACGNDDEKGDEEKASQEEQKDEDKEKEKDEEEEDPEDEDEEKDTDQDGDNDFSELIEYMEEETEGTASVMYENDETQEHDMDGVNVILDGYTLVELKDFHTNFSIPFNDQTDGAVILAKYTVDNTTDDDVYYMPTLNVSFTGVEKYFDNYKDLLPEDEQLKTILAPSNDYLLEAGDTVSGYYAYPLGDDFLDEALEAGTVSVEVSTPLEEPEAYDKKIGKEGKFSLALDDDGAEKVSSSGDFYEDKVTFEDMGDKEMIKEKSDIGESEELGDYTVELDGYQFTEFTPNKDEEARFSNFENGVVLLTVKFNLENDGDASIGLNSTTSNLIVNDGSQLLLSEGMLLNYTNTDVVEPGDSGELLQVFTLEKEQYDKIWKDKAFEIEFGPFKDEEAKDISKGKEATFTLPE